MTGPLHWSRKEPVIDNDTLCLYHRHADLCHYHTQKLLWFPESIVEMPWRFCLRFTSRLPKDLSYHLRPDCIVCFLMSLTNSPKSYVRHTNIKWMRKTNWSQILCLIVELPTGMMTSAVWLRKKMNMGGFPRQNVSTHQGWVFLQTFARVTLRGLHLFVSSGKFCYHHLQRVQCQHQQRQPSNFK